MHNPVPPPNDAFLLDAVLRIAREECRYGQWEEIEPALAASWERLRQPSSPHWEDVAAQVRTSCEDQGLLH
jgi:hypothetical protein